MKEKGPQLAVLQRVCCTVVGLLLAFGLPSSSSGQDEANWETLDEIPARFFEAQDAKGYTWQVVESGAITSGGASYLQSGGRLLVAGQPVIYEEARVLKTSQGKELRLEIEGKVGELQVKREFWFDRKRAAVRIFDRVFNPGPESVEAAVLLRTTFPFAWQTLHGETGRLLGGGDGIRLTDSDRSVTIHFSQAEGRHATVVGFGPGDLARKPTISASVNRRELSLNYETKIPANESRGLIHWMLQRNLPEIGNADEAVAAVMSESRWIDPQIDTEFSDRLINAAESSLRSPRALGSAGQKVVLNEWLDQAGLHSRDFDRLWIDAAEAIVGQVESDGEWTLTDRFGDSQISQSEVAAIRGSKGELSRVEICDRSGNVYVAELTAPGLRIIPRNGENAIPIDLSQFDLLVFAEDGKPWPVGESSTHFVEWRDGSVRAVNLEGDFRGFPVLPLGQINGTAIDSLEYQSQPWPVLRMRLKTAEEISWLQEDSPQQWQVPGLGNGVLEMPGLTLRRIWSVEGGYRPLSRSVWSSLADVVGGIPGDANLLVGNRELVAARLADESIRFQSGGVTVVLPSAEVIAITSLALESSDSPRFKVGLASGDSLSGYFESSHLNWIRDDVTFALPVESIQEYRITP
ncbi:MAG: hypothetical protein AAF236_03595 [Verrucomicrobiota bacterium]